MKFNSASHKVRNSGIYFHGKLTTHQLQTKCRDTMVRCQTNEMASYQHKALKSKRGPTTHPETHFQPS